MATTLPKQVKEQAYRLRLPDYFFDRQVYLAVGPNGQTDHWPTAFLEARLIGGRIIVLHPALDKKGWTTTDFLSGGAIATAGSKTATWRQTATLLQAAPDDVFDGQIPINSRLFRQAFNQLLNEVIQAKSQTERRAYVAAARAIIDEVLEFDERSLPLLAG